jgi:uncharacterized DUF497 family protein
VFEWDENKRQSNIDRHGIDFLDVLSLFSHPDALAFEDARQDYGEDRFILLCRDNGRLFHVAYTQRGERIRIISARRGNKRERRYYERRKQN